ncbi:hypothetical protein RHGRI_033889 [Rhododendron griersonianum]|uniref:Uncharacterized protein n=1 Tax=Rhododendron griersonianum TaxID=479676 RepID=A0AAV6HYH2_9ERIC|nr:hypothetical protein RHGRI_033889 [Rhododendron griersonianum]
MVVAVGGSGGGGGRQRRWWRFWGNNRGGFPGSRKWLQSGLFLGRHLCHYGAATGAGSPGSGGDLGASPVEVAALDDEC